MKSELAADAAGPAQFPQDGRPEVAVLGRSNVGKSSFVNVVLGRRRLARTSSTPGKTRRIHFYSIDTAMYLVDLPGFGYAAVGKEERRRWRPLVESYLRGSRSALRGAVLLIDIRRGPKDEEREILDWLTLEDIPHRVAFTKADKLKRSRRAERRRGLTADLELPPEETAAVSSPAAEGFSPVAGWIRAWTGFEPRRADGTAF